MQQVYGYVRVSTKDQNEARQMDALTVFKIAKENIFIDKQSGKNFNRPQYKKMIKRIKAGDLLVLPSIDRLGRNYEEILEQWRVITKEKQADIFVVDFPLLDTRTKYGENDLTGRFLADLVLQILAYVAQKERENIRRRQAEGIASAKARGVHLGRKPAPLPKKFYEMKTAWESGKLSVRQAAKGCGMPSAKFYSRVLKTKDSD
ncbi:MAG: recombinase family protein [Firmicutes bacterium]|nr:recombinase family protein [Bacillota bacterium]